MSDIQMVCGICGSANVRADAYAYWDADNQLWKLADTFDKGAVCEDCEGETRIEEVFLDTWKENLTKTQDMHSLHLGVEVEIAVQHYDELDPKPAWRGIVSESDVGQIYSTFFYPTAEQAKDAARRWAMHGREGY